MNQTTNTAGIALDLTKLEALARAAADLPDTFQPYVNHRGEITVGTFSLDRESVDVVARYLDGLPPATVLQLIQLARRSTSGSEQCKPDGWIAAAYVKGELTSVAFRDVDTALACCAENAPVPFWTSPASGSDGTAAACPFCGGDKGHWAGCPAPTQDELDDGLGLSICIMRRPGMAPEIKNPFGDIAAYIRELYAHNPDADITLVRVWADLVGCQSAEDARECLEMQDDGLPIPPRRTAASQPPALTGQAAGAVCQPLADERTPYRWCSVDGKQHDTGCVMYADGGFLATTASPDKAKFIADALNERAALAQQAGAPAGYKLVPIEPTLEMQQAGHDTPGAHMYNASYRAMVVAAPSPSAEKERDARVLYTCIGKGGEYELIGTATGAGAMSKLGDMRVYRSTKGGRLFFRTMDDFDARMQRIDAAKGTAGQEGA
jgi:hypothetical protein